MPLLPIDLQTLFTQTSQVGKEQAVQKDASPLAQSAQGAQMAQKAEQRDSAVNETRDQDDGSEKIKDPTGRGARRKKGGQAGHRKAKAGEAAPELDVVQDPALGRNIDITS
jgi:hypothetical protein